MNHIKKLLMGPEPFHRNFKYLDDLGFWIEEDNGFRSFVVDVTSVYFRSFDTMMFNSNPNRYIFYLIFKVTPDGNWSTNRISDYTYKIDKYEYDWFNLDHPLRRLRSGINKRYFPNLFKYVNEELNFKNHLKFYSYDTYVKSAKKHMNFYLEDEE